MEKELSDLIVDDEESARKLLCKLLEETLLFSEIRLAHSVASANNHLSDFIRDIIFLDIKKSTVFATDKGSPFYHVLVSDNDHNVFDQWNMKDTITKEFSLPFFGNYDNDKFSEIYIFSYKEDSVFLNVNEFFEIDGAKSERFFITKYGCRCQTNLASRAYRAESS